MKLKGRQIGSEKEKTNKDGKKTFIVRQTKRKKRKTERLYVRVFTERKRREERWLFFIFLVPCYTTVTRQLLILKTFSKCCCCLRSHFASLVLLNQALAIMPSLARFQSFLPLSSLKRRLRKSAKKQYRSLFSLSSVKKQFNKLTYIFSRKQKTSIFLSLRYYLFFK